MLTEDHLSVIYLQWQAPKIRGYSPSYTGALSRQTLQLTSHTSQLSSTVAVYYLMFLLLTVALWHWAALPNVMNQSHRLEAT